MTHAKDRGDSPLELNLREFDRLLEENIQTKRKDVEAMKAKGEEKEHMFDVVDNQLYSLERVQRELERLVGPWL